MQGIQNLTVINGFGDDYFESGHQRYIRMLPTPNNQGVFIFTKIGTYELSCNTKECNFQKSSLKLQYDREWPVVMYIEEDLVNCP